MAEFWDFAQPARLRRALKLQRCKRADARGPEAAGSRYRVYWLVVPCHLSPLARVLTLTAFKLTSVAISGAGPSVSYVRGS